MEAELASETTYSLKIKIVDEAQKKKTNSLRILNC